MATLIYIQEYRPCYHRNVTKLRKNNDSMTIQKYMSKLISVRFILAYQMAITYETLTSMLKVQYSRLQFKKTLPYHQYL